MKPALLALLVSVSLAAACSSKKEGAKGEDRPEASAEAKAKAKAKATAKATAKAKDDAGQLMVDGKPFVVASCAAGSKQKFVGFDLRSKDQRRLWVSAVPPGRARVHIFRTPVLPVELGVCAEAEVNEIEQPVGGVTGSFTASCDALGHTVTGGMTITDCR